MLIDSDLKFHSHTSAVVNKANHVLGLIMKSSAIKSILNHVRTDILTIKDDDFQLTKDIKSKIMSYLKDKYDDPDMNTLLDLAGFYPCFKTYFIDSENLDLIKDKVIVEAMTIATKARETLHRDREREATGDLGNDEMNEVEPPPKKKITPGST